jgi:hypothetical protein
MFLFLQVGLYIITVSMQGTRDLPDCQGHYPMKQVFKECLISPAFISITRETDINNTPIVSQLKLHFNREHLAAK